MIRGYDHVLVAAIPASAEPAARAFYADLPGMTELPKPAVLAGRGGCWFSSGSAVLHLGVEMPFRPASKAHPASAASTRSTPSAIAWSSNKVDRFAPAPATSGRSRG
jgi:hypothetical protein